MLKKLLLAVLASIALTGVAMAAVDVNTADQAQLETVKGIGSVHAKAIIDERNAHGPFKDEHDLANRVKGLGEKSVTKLEAAGLTVGGKGAATAAAATAAPAKAKAAKSAKASAATGVTATAAGTSVPAEAKVTASTDSKMTEKSHKKSKKAKDKSEVNAPAAASAAGQKK